MPNFPKNKHFLPPDRYTCVIRLLPYCQRYVLHHGINKAFAWGTICVFLFFLKKFCDTLKHFSENLYQIKNFALNFTFPVTSGMKWITTAWLFCLFSLTIILFTNRQFTKQLTSGKSYFKSSYTRNLHPDSGFNQARHYWNLIPFLTTKLNAPPKQSEHFKISSYILETFVALLKYKECLSRSVGFSVYNTKFSRSIVYIRRKHFHN